MGRRAGIGERLAALAIVTAASGLQPSLSAEPAVARAERQEIALDRIVSRVNGRIITQSDVRQARTLALVDDTSSDEAVRHALENRWLILGELARAAPLPPPTDEELMARRREWQASRGAGAGASGLSDPDLDAWFRDDLRIRAFLGRQFDVLPPAERPQARAEWLARLRQRADLD